MSISLLTSNESRYSRDLNRLQSDLATSVSKENSSVSKIASATSKLQKATTPSRQATLQREIARENQKIASEKKKQASLQKKIAHTNKKLNDIRIKLSKERNKEFERQLRDLSNNQQQTIRNMERDLGQGDTHLPKKEIVKHDIFFSYAHENSDYADELVQKLKDADIDVVFDKNDLGWGDSIIDFINEHMIGVRFAIILVTPEYLQKYWTQYELKSLLQRHSGMDGQSLILPIWHNVTKDEVAKRNLALTYFNAMLTAINSQEEIVESVKKLLEE